MTENEEQDSYTPTEAKYKGGAEEMYITYDLEQETRGEHRALYPKVKRVYIAGDVKNWEVGTFEKKSGKIVYGVKIEYEQTRKEYDRKGYTAKRSDTGTEYKVPPTHVEASSQDFKKIVEVPEEAQNVQFHTDKLPKEYQDALQDVR